MPVILTTLDAVGTRMTAPSKKAHITIVTTLAVVVRR
jgi:hypothetical protein